MQGFLYDLWLGFDRSKYKVAILICFATFFFCLRTLLELKTSGVLAKGDTFLTLFSGIHYVFWYISTFLMILVFFRYVARAPLQTVVYILLSAGALLVPILSASLAGIQTQFMYLSYHDPDLFKSVASLMYLSPTNHHMFYELLLLVVGVPVIAYLFCRDITRAAMTLICVYGALIFIQAFVFVCSLPVCVYVTDSDVPIAIFLCFYSIVVICAWTAAFLFPEIREYAAADKTVFTQSNIFWALAFFIPYGAVAMLMSGYLIDLFLMSASYFVCFYTTMFLFKHWRQPQLLGLNTFFALYDLLMLATFGLTALTFFS